MHLISCDGCGIVFDKEKIPVSPNANDYWDDVDGTYDSDCVTYCSQKEMHVSFLECPICKKKIKL